MKHNNLALMTMIICSLFLMATASVQAADVTVTDVIEDVSSIDYLTSETTIVTSHPLIDVDNIDIVKATYSQQNVLATVTLQVRGLIEDRGKMMNDFGEDSLDNFDFVEYDFQLITSEQEYTISYANRSGQVSSGVETKNLTSTDFTVQSDTLSITFSLVSAEEIYENLSVTSMFVKLNLTAEDPDFTNFVYLSDVAPNPALEIMDAYSESDVGLVGETIQFNASVQPFTGQPPYIYYWAFGDGGTSNALNPTHEYTTAGEYTYTFTVTDQAGETATETGTITISSQGDGSNGSSNNNMLIFLAILAVIIIVGIVIIVWIIRR